MHTFLSAFKHAMVNCDIIRNGAKIATHKGLINDTKNYNFISFDPSVDVQAGDVISVPLKTNVTILYKQILDYLMVSSIV